MKLFLDLDGVLADFEGGVLALTGRKPDPSASRSEIRAMWKALAAADDFYNSLNMMHDAQLLWDFCKPFKPVILTGLPLGDWAPAQKRRWVARMLGGDVEVVTCMARDKYQWAAVGHVLVDDRAKAREPWEQAGGTFIHHVSAARSIAALKRLGF